MQQKNMFHSLVKVVFGKKYILMMTDTAEIMSRTEQLENNQKYKQTFAKLSQSIKNHIISGGALAIGLSLSLQRYFPSSFSVLSMNKILFDLCLATLCLFTATNLSLKKNFNEILKIKKQLMLNYDRSFMNHMSEIEIKYDIDEDDQVRGVFTQDEYKEWVGKRHEYLL